MFIDIIEKVDIVKVLVISFLDELRLGFWFSAIMSSDNQVPDLVNYKWQSLRTKQCLVA